MPNVSRFRQAKLSSSNEAMGRCLSSVSVSGCPAGRICSGGVCCPQRQCPDGSTALTNPAACSAFQPCPASFECSGGKDPARIAYEEVSLNLLSQVYAALRHRRRSARMAARRKDPTPADPLPDVQVTGRVSRYPTTSSSSSCHMTEQSWSFLNNSMLSQRSRRCCLDLPGNNNAQCFCNLVRAASLFSSRAIPMPHPYPFTAPSRRAVLSERAVLPSAPVPGRLGVAVDAGDVHVQVPVPPRLSLLREQVLRPATLRRRKQRTLRPQRLLRLDPVSFRQFM